MKVRKWNCRIGWIWSQTIRYFRYITSHRAGFVLSRKYFYLKRFRKKIVSSVQINIFTAFWEMDSSECYTPYNKTLDPFS